MVEVVVVEMQVNKVVTVHHQMEVEWMAWVELQILKLRIHIQEEVVVIAVEHLVEVVW